MRVIEQAPMAMGRARGLQVRVTSYGRYKHYMMLDRTRWKPNLVLQEWGSVVAKLLAGEGQAINMLYLEFANSAAPVAPPVYDRSTDSGIAYYNSLNDDAIKDYLRVPTINGTVGSSDALLFPLGNTVLFFGMSAGVEGVHGKPFSAASVSRLIGAALVSSPSEGDPTQDMIFSRFYFEQSEQQPKLDTSQIGVEWEIVFQ